MNRLACAGLGLALALCVGETANSKPERDNDRYRVELRLWAMATVLKDLCPKVGYYIQPLPSQESMSEHLFYLAPDFLGFQDRIDTLPDYELEKSTFIHRLLLATKATKTLAEANAVLARQCEFVHQDTYWSGIFTRNVIIP